MAELTKADRLYIIERAKRMTDEQLIEQIDSLFEKACRDNSVETISEVMTWSVAVKRELKRRLLDE